MNGHYYSNTLDKMLHDLMNSELTDNEKTETLQRMRAFIDELLKEVKTNEKERI